MLPTATDASDITSQRNNSLRMLNRTIAMLPTKKAIAINDRTRLNPVQLDDPVISAGKWSPSRMAIKVMLRTTTLTALTAVQTDRSTRTTTNRWRLARASTTTETKVNNAKPITHER